MLGIWESFLDFLDRWGFGEGPWPFILAALVLALGVWLGTRPAMYRAKTARSKMEREQSNITRVEADALLDGLSELEARLDALEDQPADLRARIDEEGTARLVLVVTNFGTRATVTDLDARVARRDGASVPAVRITAVPVTLGPGETARLPWPDEAGPASSYVVLFRWSEEGTPRDAEVVVLHPAL